MGMKEREFIELKKLKAILDRLGVDAAVYDGVTEYLKDEEYASDLLYKESAKDPSYGKGEERIARINREMVEMGFLDNTIWRKSHAITAPNLNGQS